MKKYLIGLFLLTSCYIDPGYTPSDKQLTTEQKATKAQLEINAIVFGVVVAAISYYVYTTIENSTKGYEIK